MAGEKNIDRYVKYKFFRDVSDGVFVDVGAADPEYLSISHRFRLDGWRAISIEPNPEFCKRYRERGYDVLAYACGDRDEDNVTFNVIDSHGEPYEGGRITYESCSSIETPRYNFSSAFTVTPIKVQLRRLDTILKENEPSLEKIDILSIDVEGYELEVLRGFSVERYKPRVIIVENLAHNSDYTRYLTERGYALHAQLEPNEIYIRIKDA